MNTITPPSVIEPGDRVELEQGLGLLAEALAAQPAPAPQALRQRLLGRVAESAERHRGMVTVRRRHMQAIELAPGIRVRWLYEATPDRARRAGEPLRLALIELQPGTRLDHGLSLALRHSEWLVVAGQARVDGVTLDFLGHHGRAASGAEPVIESAQGATIYLRDSGDEPSPAGTSADSDALWDDYAPGIRRRLLWQAGSASAYLARAQNGALVPSHGHLNDEECLMIEGDLFVGDILVREGDFQLAPAGEVHGTVQAGSDCLVYIRGDAELAIDLGDPTR